MIANLYEQTFAVTTPPTFNSTTPPLTRLRSATSPAKDVHTFIVRHFRLQTSATNVMERAWQSIVLICCWMCVFAWTVFHSHTLVLGLIVSAWTSRIDVSHLKQHEATMMDITWDTLCRTSTGSNCSKHNDISSEIVFHTSCEFALFWLAGGGIACCVQCSGRKREYMGALPACVSVSFGCEETSNCARWMSQESICKCSSLLSAVYAVELVCAGSLLSPALPARYAILSESWSTLET